MDDPTESLVRNTDLIMSYLPTQIHSQLGNPKNAKTTAKGANLLMLEAAGLVSGYLLLHQFFTPW